MRMGLLTGSPISPKVSIQHQGQCTDSHRTTAQWPPSTLPYFDMWEKPLCLPPWPLADLRLPGDRTLNIASPPVEMSEEQGPLQSVQWLGHDYHGHLTHFISSEGLNFGGITHGDIGILQKGNRRFKPPSQVPFGVHKMIYFDRSFRSFCNDTREKTHHCCWVPPVQSMYQCKREMLF